MLSEPVLGHALHRWLHLLLSILGLVLLAAFLRRWWRTAPLHGPVAPVAPQLRWSVVVGLLAIASVAGLRAARQASATLPTLSGPVITAGILGFCSVVAVGGLLGAVVWHIAAARGVVQGPAGAAPLTVEGTSVLTEPTTVEPVAGRIEQVSSLGAFRWSHAAGCTCASCTA